VGILAEHSIKVERGAVRVNDTVPQLEGRPAHTQAANYILRPGAPLAESGCSGPLTTAKMAECRWLKPVLVGQFEYVEWTGDAHLRHSRFMGLREDKTAKDVRRE